MDKEHFPLPSIFLSITLTLRRKSRREKNLPLTSLSPLPSHHNTTQHNTTLTPTNTQIKTAINYFPNSTS